MANRSGSVRKSISTIRPPRTVKAPIENGLPFRKRDPAGRAVDQRAPDRQVDPGEHQGLAGDRLGAADLVGQPGRAAVGSEDDLGVEHGDQPLEVAVSGCGEECLEDLELGGGVSDRESGAVPRTRRRARLASCRVASGERSRISPMSPNGTANMS